MDTYRAQNRHDRVAGAHGTRNMWDGEVHVTCVSVEKTVGVAVEVLLGYAVLRFLIRQHLHLVSGKSNDFAQAHHAALATHWKSIRIEFKNTAWLLHMDHAGARSRAVVRVVLMQLRGAT